jgi:hypothetical protein
MTFAETWENADPDAVGGDDLTPPADGLHEATLVGGGAWTSKKGVDWVRFEFVLNDGSEFKWSVLHGFKSQAQAGFTKREVRALGIDVEQLPPDLAALDAAIKEKLGGYYVVRVERDGKFESTYVEDVATAATTPGAPSAPAPEAAPAPAPAGSTGTDDDIPF